MLFPAPFDNQVRLDAEPRSYFEWSGDNTKPDYDKNVWTGIANVWRNRWLLTNEMKGRYGFTTKGFKQMFYSDPGQPFWTSKRQLKSQLVSNPTWTDPESRNKNPGIVQILNSDPKSGLCKGFSAHSSK